MFTLSNPAHRQRFWRAYDNADQLLRPFRVKRTAAINRYVGSEYGERIRGKARKVLVNHTLTLVSTYSFMLAANRPQVNIATDKRDLAPFALRYETATNNLLEEVKAQETFRAVVEDALFGIGLARVAFAPGNVVEIPNPDLPAQPHPSMGLEAQFRYRAATHAMPHSILVDAGKPSFERISLDDTCFDLPAKQWENMRWIGWSYRVSLEDAMSDERFNPEVRKQLYSDSKYGENSGERASDISTQGGGMDHDDLEDMVTLMDVYLPKEGRWAILSKKQKDLAPLIESDFDGPEEGPFHRLSFFNVPDNIMPVSLAATLGPIVEAAEELRRKNTLDAINQKTILAYQGDGRDPENIVNAQHMQPVKVQNVQSVREMSFNGVNQGTAAAMVELESAFSRAAGNLDAMAGLGPQSATYGQDKLIKDSNNTIIQKMGDQVRTFAKLVVSGLGWMLWVDSTKHISGTHKFPGLDPMPMNWSPEEREGDFWQYNFQIEVDSMRYKTPEEKLSEVTNIITSVYLPALPILSQMGVGIDFSLLADYQAKVLRCPILRDLITVNGIGLESRLTMPTQGLPPGAQQQQSPTPLLNMGGGGPSRTEYVRQSQAQGTNPMQMLIQAAAGSQAPQVQG